MKRRKRRTRARFVVKSDASRLIPRVKRRAHSCEVRSLQTVLSSFSQPSLYRSLSTSRHFLALLHARDRKRKKKKYSSSARTGKITTARMIERGWRRTYIYGRMESATSLLRCVLFYYLSRLAARRANGRVSSPTANKKKRRQTHRINYSSSKHTTMTLTRARLLSLLALIKFPPLPRARASACASSTAVRPSTDRCYLRGASLLLSVSTVHTRATMGSPIVIRVTRIREDDVHIRSTLGIHFYILHDHLPFSRCTSFYFFLSAPSPLFF